MIDEKCHANIEWLSRIVKIRKPVSLVFCVHEHAQYGREARLLTPDCRQDFRGECRAEDENKLRFEGRRDGARQFHGVHDQLLESADMALCFARSRNRQHRPLHASVPKARPNLNKLGKPPREENFRSNIQPGSLRGGCIRPNLTPGHPLALEKAYGSAHARVCIQ